MTLYNTIGNNYNETREADERILHHIITLLHCPTSSLIADIGAGTGNYSYALAARGYTIHALEPSDTMQKQKKLHDSIVWYKSFAEDMPFANSIYDGVICIMSTHHFSSLEKSFVEIHRILKPHGHLVIFTADLRMAGEHCWLKDYFNPHYTYAGTIHPPCADIKKLVESQFGTQAIITPFPLPHNLKDGFFYSAWRHPEKYLDADFRKGISCFALVDTALTDMAIQRLEHDLRSGAWDRRYGAYRAMELYNGGYFFLSIAK